MFRFCLIIILLSGIASCSKNSQSKNNSRLTVTVTNYPLLWIVESITEKEVDTLYPVPKDIDPAFWEPTDIDLLALDTSDIIFINGATYEKWMTTVDLPVHKTFDTSKSFQNQYRIIKNAVTHVHDGKEHSHDGVDFNTWLNPEMLLKQADSVYEALRIKLPGKSELFKNNYITLRKKILDFAALLKKESVKESNFFASHPVYGYLGEFCNWDIKSFIWEPDQMPSEEDWKKLEEIKGHSKYMLYEDEPISEIITRLNELEIKVIVFKTCNNIPDSDYLSVMKENIKNLSEAFSN